jgi:hypothetical protein
MSELHDCGACMMHAGYCRTFEDALGIGSLSRGQSQELHVTGVF